LSRRPFEYLLSLGSNVEPRRSVERGLALLARRFEVVAVSPCYDVAAVGVTAQPRFLNAGIRLRTDLPPRALREALRRIEEVCGRRRGADRFAPRTLDLDAVFAAPGVPGAEALPHPDLLAHGYVLCPCAAIWPDALHPGAGLTLEALVARDFPDWAAEHQHTDCDSLEERHA
jgi:2-amino-4-hydroxy-6-hydroxymethyldihydropteridine diphosphokinase